MKLQLGRFALLSSCPACGSSAFLKYGEDETKVRCLRCRATPISLSLIHAIATRVGQLSAASGYEASSRGPVVKFLRGRLAKLTTSEYFSDTARGEFKNGIQCQDLQELTFDDEVFDICSSTEVFEHVGDDRKAFREMFRVLRPGGSLVFTVPLSSSSRTIERAMVKNGELSHLLPPMFHGDRLTGTSTVLVFRDYGLDVVDRVRAAGFSSVELAESEQHWFGFSRRVVIARK